MISYQRLSLIVSLICAILSSGQVLTHSLMVGTIQFPLNVSSVPSVRIYCAGKIIPCTIDQRGKTVSFTIPKYQGQDVFNLLVTERVGFSFNESKYQDDTHNTASFLRLKEGQPYRLFHLMLMPKITENRTQLIKEWRIRPSVLSLRDFRVPDDAIIVCLNPDWVAGLDTKSCTDLQLPTIDIKSNIIELTGSADKFLESSAKIMLAALDSDTMHANQEAPEMRHLENRITIAAPAA